MFQTTLELGTYYQNNRAHTNIIYTNIPILYVGGNRTFSPVHQTLDEEESEVGKLHTFPQTDMFCIHELNAQLT